MPELKALQFKASARAAVANAQLQAGHQKLAHFRTGRDAMVVETGPERWAELQDQARAIKWNVLDNLDHYLGQLADNVEKAGGHVFFAGDAREANEYIVNLAKARGVKTVVKGKSMASEELGIAEEFEKLGIRRVETDLGEYIVQLAHEPPYHIIAPAVHKSKEQVLELFAQNGLDTTGATDIPGIAGVARKALRQAFLQADMGMTGANFAIAETGHVAIVTNEGNGRMCSSLPRIHVVTMGMERVIPRFQDLDVFLKLLTRSATGQRITSYVSLFNGPRRNDEEDGPEEFHLVILDNGRSRLLANPELREALLCIRCGACLNACPVYNKVGGHTYGWVYPGPIGAVVTPVMVGIPRAKDLPYASTLCGACREVCPLKINLPRMLLVLRREATEGQPQNRASSLTEGMAIKAWYAVVRTGIGFTLAGKLGFLLQRPFVRRGQLRWLPPPLSAWLKSRDFPALAAKPFRTTWKNSRAR
jgi:L-lactate dehydrogenase complex protein LldF